MLTKDDLKQIQTLIGEGLADFFNNDLVLYLSKKFGGISKEFEENDNDHEEILRRLDKNDLDHEKIKEKINQIDLKIEAHDVELRKVAPLR